MWLPYFVPARACLWTLMSRFVLLAFSNIEEIVARGQHSHKSRIASGVYAYSSLIVRSCNSKSATLNQSILIFKSVLTLACCASPKLRYEQIFENWPTIGIGNLYRWLIIGTGGRLSVDHRILLFRLSLHNWMHGSFWSWIVEITLRRAIDWCKNKAYTTFDGGDTA